MIDLRSDTVTKPTPKMLDVMFTAEVGDDVFQEDPSINYLQEYGAQLFGHEAALFCPSGTMTNQIAVNVHTQPGDEIICSELCHIYNYEGGGVARNSGVQVKLTNDARGLLTKQEVLDRINPADSHYANTSLVCLEDTVNKAGGVCYELSEIKKIKSACSENNLKLHLDGARVFNSLVNTGYDYHEYGSQFDTMSVCLSKGLGAPSGSLLIGSKKFIQKAHRVRKSMGGGMRQAGIIAAGGLFGLKNNIERLTSDHVRASSIAAILRKTKYVTSVISPETNIVIFNVEDSYGVDKFLDHLSKHDVKALPFSKSEIRFVTHLHISDNDIDKLEDVLSNL